MRPQMRPQNGYSKSTSAAVEAMDLTMDSAAAELEMEGEVVPERLNK